MAYKVCKIYRMEESNRFPNKNLRLFYLNHIEFDSSRLLHGDFLTAQQRKENLILLEHVSFISTQ